MKKVTQKELVLRHLQDYGSISSWEGFTDYGITRLSAIIYNLRSDGVQISSETITTTNRYGNPTHYSKYILVA